jgi:hypothetical protein
MEEKLNITDLLQSIRELSKSQDKSYTQLKEAQEARNLTQEKSYAQLKNSQEKTEKLVRALTQDIFGISNSMGLEAEEFFYNSIKNKMQLGGIKFDYIAKNLKNKIKGENYEVDIFLENGNSVGVVEVKNKVTKNTIKQMDKIIERFYYFNPYFKDYKVIGGIAGKVFPEDLQKEALKKGYSVLIQKGSHMEQLSP